MPTYKFPFPFVCLFLCLLHYTGWVGNENLFLVFDCAIVVLVLLLVLLVCTDEYLLSREKNNIKHLLIFMRNLVSVCFYVSRQSFCRTCIFFFWNWLWYNQGYCNRMALSHLGFIIFMILHIKMLTSDWVAGKRQIVDLSSFHLGFDISNFSFKNWKYGSSRPDVFCKKDFLKNFAKFTENTRVGVSFLIKL